MATLFKRSNGVYYFIYEVGGKRRWKSTNETNKQSALKSLVNLDVSKPAPPRRLLLSLFIEEFFRSAVSNYSAGTLKIYKDALSNFQSVVGDLPLQSVSLKHIDNFKTERLKTVLPVTLNIDLRTLRAAFNVGIKWKLIQDNPFRKVELMRIPEQQPIFLSKQNFKKLMSVIPAGVFHDLVMIAVFTGLRRGELVNLAWKDIDFEKKLIYIHSTENFQTKAGRRRTVPMNEIVYQLLSKWYQVSTHEMVFTHEGRNISENYVTYKFKRYVRNAELNDSLHFHSLRHTFATWLVQEGVNIYEVQKLLGHSSVKITEIYSHLLSSELHNAVNKIEVSLN